MALIVGGIISVGTFNLPTSPGGLQPDRSHLDGADDSGRARPALLSAALSRRLPANDGPYVYARIAFSNHVGFANACVLSACNCT